MSNLSRVLLHHSLLVILINLSYAIQGQRSVDFLNGNGGFVDVRRRCPVCDSSIFSYCDDKLFHDSCCCHNPNNPYDRLPIQCQFADCSFLHANSCPEHKLITACCCTSLFI